MTRVIQSKTVFPKEDYDFSFKWRIEDFNLRCHMLIERGMRFYSPDFYDNVMDCVWTLEFNRCIEHPVMEMYLSSGVIDKKMYGIYKFTFYDKEDRIVLDVLRSCNEGRVYANVELCYPEHTLLDVLQVEVRIKMFMDQEFENSCPSPIRDVGNLTMCKYIHSLFNSDKLTDVTIRSKGKDFSAHKIVLSAYSPVFDTMFSEQWKTDETNAVDMVEFEEETVRKFLQFLYQQCSLNEDSFNILSELYQLADKYDVKSLRDICKEYLIKNVDNDSALHLLWLGERYSNDEMKHVSIMHIRAHPASLSNISKCVYLTLKEPQIVDKIESGEKFL